MKTSRNFSKYILFSIFFLAALLLLTLFAWMQLNGRLPTAEFLLNVSGKPANPSQITATYFTENRFSQIKGLALFLSAVSFLVSFLAYRFFGLIAAAANKANNRFRLEGKEFISIFTGLTRGQKVIAGAFFLLSAGTKIYFLNWFPAHTDELYSYLYFVKKGFLVTISHYPIPNNHVFSNVISGFFYLTGLPPLLVMRLPVLLTSLVLSMFIFAALKRSFGFGIALLASVFFSFAHMSIYYSVHGRGYMLLCFFAWIATFTLVKYLLRKCRFYLVIFGIASVLGFYTIPVFAYFFASAVSFAGVILFFRKEPRLVLNLAGTAVVVLFFSTILYSPIILISGVSGFFGSDYRNVINQDFSLNLRPYVVSVLDDFTGLSSLGFLIPLSNVLFAGIYFLRKERSGALNQQRLAIAMFTWIMVSPVLIIGLQQVLLPNRIWIYWSLFNYSLLAISIGFLLNRFVPKKNLHYGLLLLIAFGFSGFQVWRLTDRVKRKEIEVFKPLPAIIPEIVNSNATKIYAEEEFYKMFILLSLEGTGKEITFDMFRAKPQTDYDYLLVLEEKPLLKQYDLTNYELVWQDERIRAFRRKNL